MGHKVNPDIFRLGFSKTWIFQLRTNKNFIKNLFLFKFLRNLFMNYTIPFFDFKKRRNTKVNDKLILRGEEQIIFSPFVKNNLLFSHVCFGLIKNKLYIESFFIDVNFKQPRKKNEKSKRQSLVDLQEYKPWNPLFYKSSLINKFSRKKSKFKLKNKNKLKKIFSTRFFKFVGKKAKVYRLKPIRRISKDLYNFLQNYNPKYNYSLHKYLDNNYSFYVKKLTKKSKNKRRKIKILLKLFKFSKRKNFNISFVRKKALKLNNAKNRLSKLKYSYLRYLNLDFVVNRFRRSNRRIVQRKGIRKLRKVIKFNPRFQPKYKLRKQIKGFRKITLPKLLRLISKSYYSSLEAFSLKKTLPKSPLYIFDLHLSNEKEYFFYKSYKNLLLLKYFIRSLKFIRFFSTKKKIFFSQNLICLLMNFFGLVNSTILTKKMYLLFQGMMFYSFSFSFFNFVNFKKKFFSRFVFFKGVSKTVYRNIIELTENKKLNFSVVGQNKFRFNSSLVLNYILIKLGQYFSIHEIINPLSYYIKGLTSISGYKILITGRLTRKERAAVMIRSGKRMPLSTIKANIDYSAGFKIMKFGLVGIKVYLLLNKSDLLNLYKFKYNYN